MIKNFIFSKIWCLSILEWQIIISRLVKNFLFIFYPKFDFFQLLARRSWDRFYASFNLLKKSHNRSFVVLKYLFWNELTFLVTYDVIMNVSLEAAVRGSCSKGMFLKFRNIHRKTHVLKSLFNKVANCCGIFKNTSFEEHLRTAASENTNVFL